MGRLIALFCLLTIVVADNDGRNTLRRRMTQFQVDEKKDESPKEVFNNPDHDLGELDRELYEWSRFLNYDTSIAPVPCPPSSGGSKKKKSKNSKGGNKGYTGSYPAYNPSYTYPNQYGYGYVYSLGL